MLSFLLEFFSFIIINLISPVSLRRKKQCFRIRVSFIWQTQSKLPCPDDTRALSDPMFNLHYRPLNLTFFARRRASDLSSLPLQRWGFATGRIFFFSLSSFSLSKQMHFVVEGEESLSIEMCEGYVSGKYLMAEAS